MVSALPMSVWGMRVCVHARTCVFVFYGGIPVCVVLALPISSLFPFIYFMVSVCPFAQRRLEKEICSYTAFLFR